MNGIASSPAVAMVARRTAGTLSGEPKWTCPFSDKRSAAVSKHQAHRRGDLAQPRHVLAAHDAGIEMRQQAGFLEHTRGHGGEIVERRRVAEPASASRAAA